MILIKHSRTDRAAEVLSLQLHFSNIFTFDHSRLNRQLLENHKINIY